jgi:phospho-N-acetylmuramoyl-pentapeptide-transferase
VIALLLAAATSMIITLIGTKFLIPWLVNRRMGQPIREEGPDSHKKKVGTPTMGGIAIVAGAIGGYTVSHLREGAIFTKGGLSVMLVIAGAAAVGLMDDWLKVMRARNLGLNSKAKMIGLLGVGSVFAFLALEWAGVQTTLGFTRFDSPGIGITRIGWFIFAVVVVVAVTNAVNLTDGLDGLAAGTGSFSLLAYTIIGFWQFRNEEIYQVPQALDLAIVAAAMAGACLGFLWWNAAPAQIMMGDTGSLAIGAAIAGLALMTRTPLLLPLVGGIYMIETLSVIIQVSYFKMSGGKRVFRMAPIHHHFELGGWPETTVIIRFWLLAGIATSLALGLFYADLISTGVLD